jgi:hypothetical protein
MGTIVLNSSQVQILLEHPDGVRACDESGREVGRLWPRTEDVSKPAVLPPDVAKELARRMSQDDIAWLTTSEMITRLKSQAAQQ